MPINLQRQLKGPGPYLNPDSSLVDFGWAEEHHAKC
jgi:hypothetical protein